MLKKKGIIGIGITFLVLSVIVGIASLPDEVLLESSTNENSQTLTEDIQSVPIEEQISNFASESRNEKNIEKTNAELNALKKELNQLKMELSQLKTVSEIPEEVSKVSEEISEVSETEDEQLEDQPESRVISVNLKDGVGALEK